MTDISSNAKRPFPLVAFWAVQVVLLVGGAVWASNGIRRMDSRDHVRPTLDNRPLVIRPLYDVPEVVSDEQLAKTLGKLVPRLAGEKPKINNVEHALRFWGLEARIGDPACLSGEQLRTLLTDHRQFAKVWGTKTPPLLEMVGQGVKVRVQEGEATSSHVDHTLASLAEVGTPLDFPVFTPQGATRFASMVKQSVADFSLNQQEYEWSALVYGLYFRNTPGWTSSEGQEITFDRIVRRMMREEMRDGVCFGNHRLYTLAALLQVDNQQSILSAECRAEVVAHLASATSRLVANQSAEGFWDGGWCGTSSNRTSNAADPQSDRFLATGHALEWWAIAPAEVQPPREVVVRAGQWLVREIEALDEAKVQAHYTFLTHAGRALALWRGKPEAGGA
jgi:hypothetical protein